MARLRARTPLARAQRDEAMKKCTVRRQRSLDRPGGLNKGAFLAHRNVHRSEDETAKPEASKEPAEKVVQDIRRATRTHYFERASSAGDLAPACFRAPARDAGATSE